MPYIYSLIVIGIIYIPVHYWIKGKKKDQEKAEKERRKQSRLNCLLSSEEMEDINSYS